MKKNMFISKNNMLKQKKLYMFLLFFSIIAIISGILFYFIISDTDKSNAKELIDNFFISVNKNEKLNYTNSLLNSLTNNISFNLIIWLLGISIIGFPIIILLLFLKCFVLGFSISTIIAKYGFKGVLKAFLYIFPHQLVSIIILVLLSFYALSFCIKLFKHLFLKEIINFREAMRKYLKILALVLLSNIILSLYETYVATYLIRLLS